MVLNSKKDKAGFLLVEVVLAVALLVLILLGAGASFWYSQDNAMLAGQRERAVLLADEAIEAVRNIRDNEFSNLSDGTYRLNNNGNTWELISGIEVIDIFSRQITISTVNADTKKISTEISWQQNLQRNGSLITETYLTNWAEPVNQNENFIINIANADIGSGGDDELQGITLENTGLTDIVIDKITISWTDTNRLIEKVRIDGDWVWRSNNEGTPDGKQPSGTELDIEDFTLLAGGGPVDIDRIEFDGEMLDNIFTITFTLSDSSTKVVVVDLSQSTLCGLQSDNFTVDISGASIGGGGKKELKGVDVSSANNACDITIDKLTVTWDNSRLIEEVRIGGSRIWKHNNEGTPDGRQSSGTELDLVDHIVSGGDTDSVNKIKFNGNMQNATFTLLFTLGDGSTELIGSFSP